MPSIDPSNIEVDNSEDFNYVSAKNYARKQQIQQGQGNAFEELIGRPGPITGIMLSIMDMCTTLFIKFSLLLLQISTIAFEWVNALIFGNFVGIIPSGAFAGTVISMKWFRYFMTVIMPPFGVFLHKGLYGWFNIFVCVLITYISYIGGIIYAFVICMRNRYADQYEDYEITKAISRNPELNSNGDWNAFWGMIVFLFIILGCLSLMIYYS
jgi:uncharacterized membrane protein YqaE (UPF0057 family)